TEHRKLPSASRNAGRPLWSWCSRRGLRAKSSTSARAQPSVLSSLLGGWTPNHSSGLLRVAARLRVVEHGGRDRTASAHLHSPPVEDTATIGPMHLSHVGTSPGGTS